MADDCSDAPDAPAGQPPVDPGAEAHNIMTTVIPSIVEDAAKSSAMGLANVAVGLLGSAGMTLAPDLATKLTLLLAALALYGFNWAWGWIRIKAHDRRLRAAVAAPPAVPVTRPYLPVLAPRPPAGPAAS